MCTHGNIMVPAILSSFYGNIFNALATSCDYCEIVMVAAVVKAPNNKP